GRRAPSPPPRCGGAAPRLHGRMELLRRLDTFPDNDRTRRLADLRERAYRLITQTSAGIGLREQDIARYGGENPVSIGVLTMRELVRQGVTGGLLLRAGNWDYHADLTDRIRVDAPAMDHALAAPVTDLKRGLLGDTLLVYNGEFGRAPRLNGFAGRDHFAWHSAFLAGPGVREGFVYGDTDAQGRGRTGVVSDEAFAALVQEAASNE